MQNTPSEYSLFQKLKLMQARFYEKLGSSVDKIGIFEVRTDNFEAVYSKVKEYFNNESWKLVEPEDGLRAFILEELKNSNVEIENNEAGYLLYKSKRNFLTVKDEQLVDIKIVHFKKFIGITITCSIPRQGILNKYKRLNDKLINELKTFLGQYHQIDNFSIQYVV